jgi:hypothetical protein
MPRSLQVWCHVFTICLRISPDDMFAYQSGLGRVPGHQEWNIDPRMLLALWPHSSGSSLINLPVPPSRKKSSNLYESASSFNTQPVAIPSFLSLRRCLCALVRTWTGTGHQEMEFNDRRWYRYAATVVPQPRYVSRHVCVLVRTYQDGNRGTKNETICFTICLFISLDLDGQRAPDMFHPHQGIKTRFHFRKGPVQRYVSTVCFFISPDLDGNRAPEGINPPRPRRSRNPNTRPQHCTRI